MEKFIKHFRREGVGIWVCLEPATLDLPQGRIQVAPGTRFTLGTRFMNIELAALLEATYAKQGGRPAPERVMGFEQCTPAEIEAIAEAMALKLGIGRQDRQVALQTLAAMEAEGSIAVAVLDAEIRITLLKPASLADEPWLVVERRARRAGEA